MKSILIFILTLSGIYSICLAQQRTIIYVSQEANGANNGTSWKDAYHDLSIAIKNAKNADIWVAKGTYYPTLDKSFKPHKDKREYTFALHDNISLYGGFEGTEKKLSERKIALNSTILNGDYNNNDTQNLDIKPVWLHPTRQDNAYRLILAYNAGNSVIDGFILKSANTKEQDPSYAIDSIAQGAAILIYVKGKEHQYSTYIQNCIFWSNASKWSVGGVRNYVWFHAKSNLTFENCLFIGNQARYGASINNESFYYGYAKAKVSNCTFLKNYAMICGAGVSNAEEPEYEPCTSEANTKYSLFWFNDANKCHTDMDDSNAFTEASFCNLQHLYAGIGNTNYYPIFRSVSTDSSQFFSLSNDYTLKYLLQKDSNKLVRRLPLIINDFFIGDKEIALNTEASHHIPVEMRLKSNENDFTISFARIGYVTPGENDIIYQLKGYNKKWKEADNSLQVNYKNLVGGSYVFQLNTKDGLELGIPSVELRISIAIPYWQTLGFKVIAALALLLSVIGIVIINRNRRLKTRIQQYKYQQQLETVRLNIAQDVHDEIGAGLSKIIQRTRDLSLEIGSEKNATILNITQIASRAIANLREIVWTLNPKFDQLSSLIAYMRRYAAEFFEHTPIQVHFNLETNDYNPIVSPNFKRQLISILKEGLHNILKHAAATEVTVQFLCQGGDKYIFIIADNGKGFNQAKVDVYANGLENMRYRAELIGAILEINSVLQQGTTIRVTGKVLKNV